MKMMSVVVVGQKSMDSNISGRLDTLDKKMKQQLVRQNENE